MRSLHTNIFHTNHSHWSQSYVHIYIWMSHYCRCDSSQRKGDRCREECRVTRLQMKSVSLPTKCKWFVASVVVASFAYTLLHFTRTLQIPLLLLWFFEIMFFICTSQRITQLKQCCEPLFSAHTTSYSFSYNSWKIFICTRRWTHSLSFLKGICYGKFNS